MNGPARPRLDATRAVLTPAWAPPPRVWVQRGDVPDPQLVRSLAAGLSLSETFCTLLATRGHSNDQRVKQLLRPRVERLLDPHALPDLGAAVSRIRRAIEQRETILVHGDYDVDGVCAAALLTRTLAELGARVTPFVPHRTRDGYDLGPAGVRAAVASGASLIVTVDCGTVARDAIAAAGSVGVDVIVTDHHLPSGDLPAAVAVVNPNRSESGYGETSLAGAGVAFKLCQALVRAFGGDETALWHRLDLVALATIADLAPLAGENRVLTHFGLRVLRESPHAGVRALLHVAGVAPDRPVTAGQVSHALAPRLNALGRLGDAGRALRLLLTDDEGEAAALARVAEEENRRRQALDRETLAQAMALLEEECTPDRDLGIVLAREGWHAGVIGIVASRLVEEVHRPVFLLTVDASAGIARGSGRSAAGVHLLDALHASAPLLQRYGGHRQAAGLDVPVARIAEFRAAFDAAVRAQIGDVLPAPEIRYDLELPLRSLDAELLARMRHLGPFGIGNPTPTFVVRGVRVAKSKVVGTDHLRLRLTADDGGSLGAIGFRMAAAYGVVARAGARIDVVVQLQEDDWAGGVQGRIVDLRACAS